MCTDRLISIAETDFSVESERQIIETGVKKYSLQYLLSRCDASIPRSSEDEAWTASNATGRELL